MLKKKGRGRKKRSFDSKKMMSKFSIENEALIDYKNISFLQKYLNERGKILPRRFTGISGKYQRLLSAAVKRARFLALLPSGGVKK